MKKVVLFLIMAILSFGIVGMVNAALIDRGGGLIYDDVLDITWLQDANYAQTSGYDADGFMNWNGPIAPAHEPFSSSSVTCPASRIFSASISSLRKKCVRFFL